MVVLQITLIINSNRVRYRSQRLQLCEMLPTYDEVSTNVGIHAKEALTYNGIMYINTDRILYILASI